MVTRHAHNPWNHPSHWEAADTQPEVWKRVCRAQRTAEPKRGNCVYTCGFQLRVGHQPRVVADLKSQKMIRVVTRVIIQLINMVMVMVMMAMAMVVMVVVVMTVVLVMTATMAMVVMVVVVAMIGEAQRNSVPGTVL